ALARSAMGLRAHHARHLLAPDRSELQAGWPGRQCAARGQTGIAGPGLLVQRCGAAGHRGGAAVLRQGAAPSMAARWSRQALKEKPILALLWALRRDPFDLRGLLAECAVRFLQVVVCLQAQPEALAGAEYGCKADCSVGADTALAQHDFIDAAWRHTRCAGHGVLADAERCEELLEEHFSGVDVGQFFHGVLAMVSGNRRSPRRAHRPPSIGSKCAIDC